MLRFYVCILIYISDAKSVKFTSVTCEIKSLQQVEERLGRHKHIFVTSEKACTQLSLWKPVRSLDFVLEAAKAMLGAVYRVLSALAEQQSRLLYLFYGIFVV